MTQFSAGDIASASAIRDAFGAHAVLGSDISVTSSTDQQDCPGLGVLIDAYAVYTIEAYIAYITGVDPEMRCALTAPPDSEGSWWVESIVDGTNANTGPVAGVRRTGFNVGSEVANEASAGGSGGAMATELSGQIRTFGFGGVLQLRFAQLYSNASSTTVVAGSWLRAYKIGSTL